MRVGHGVLLAAAALAATGLALAGPAGADHPAEEAIVLVVDGPRHDLAFDPEGPMQALHEADGAAFANDTWAAGPAKTVPGHAALLTGKAQTIANDGSQRPQGPMLWEQLAAERGWGLEQMRWLYQKDKLAVLDSPHVGGGEVEGWPPDEAMLDAVEANVSDPDSRLVVASFAWPDDTGHRGDWADHRASLATIANGTAELVATEADGDTLVLVTADHARYCGDPEDHGQLGPLGAGDDCDAHVPTWVAGWHVRANATVDACLTQADLGVLVADALNASYPDAEGRFPAPLVDADAAWDSANCPPDRGGVLGVPAPGASAVLAVLASLGALATSRRR